MSHSSGSIVGPFQRYASLLVQWTSTGPLEEPVGSRAESSDSGHTPSRNEDTPAQRGETPVDDGTGRAVTSDPSKDIDPTSVETSYDVLLNLGLTESEFVLELLAAHDGKLPQQAFVEQLDWSKSKVSRLLSDIEDDGRIVRVSIGQEKVVYTPDRAPGRDPFSHLEGDDAPDEPTSRPAETAATTGARRRG
jgi:hypothetical protein